MDDQKTVGVAAIAKSVEKIADSKGIAAVGVGLGWGIAAMAVALIFFAPSLHEAAGKWDGHLHAQTGCYDIKDVNGTTYRVNTCTGELQKLPLPEQLPVQAQSTLSHPAGQPTESTKK